MTNSTLLSKGLHKLSIGGGLDDGKSTLALSESTSPEKDAPSAHEYIKHLDYEYLEREYNIHKYIPSYISNAEVATPVIKDLIIEKPIYSAANRHVKRKKKLKKKIQDLHQCKNSERKAGIKQNIQERKQEKKEYLEEKKELKNSQKLERRELKDKYKSKERKNNTGYTDGSLDPSQHITAPEDEVDTAYNGDEGDELIFRNPFESPVFKVLSSGAEAATYPYESKPTNYTTAKLNRDSVGSIPSKSRSLSQSHSQNHVQGDYNNLYYHSLNQSRNNSSFSNASNQSSARYGNKKRYRHNSIASKLFGFVKGSSEEADSPTERLHGNGGINDDNLVKNNGHSYDQPTDSLTTPPSEEDVCTYRGDSEFFSYPLEKSSSFDQTKSVMTNIRKKHHGLKSKLKSTFGGENLKRGIIGTYNLIFFFTWNNSRFIF